MLHHIGQIATSRGLRVLCLGLLSAVAPTAALAQRPFAVHDPFYRGETGRRPFYDGYALTTELSYRSPGQAIQPDPLGVSFRAEYQLGPQFDVGAILDASGGTGRTLAVSWVTLKYYSTEENTDRALRLAVDPAVDGRLGNPQVDLAYLSTTLLRPNLSQDYGFGVRRVRVGYEQIVDAPDGGGAPPERPVENEVVFTRALGWEMHAMTQYSLLVNPARNNLFVSGLFYLGNYDMVESSMREVRPVENAGPGNGYTDGGRSAQREYRAAAVWVRSGFEYNRPAFQVAPYVSFAVRRWMPSSRRDERPARLNFGLRFMLR